MKQLFTFIIVIVAAIFLPGCHGSGSPAPAPGNVSIVAGDSSATVSWDMTPGVEYWIFSAAAGDITPDSCYGMSQCKIIMKVVSPAVIPGLTNGITYSVSINGRIDGGKGGPGSPSVQTIPRLAGATWSVGSTLGSTNLNGVTHGQAGFVSVGNSGALFSSIDGINWKALTNPHPSSNLNAAAYYGGNYLAVGAGGVILLSTDAVTWTLQTNLPAPTPDLYAISDYGVAGYVATGANGTIIRSDISGNNWTLATASNTLNPLYGITYGNGMYMAVGAAGTLLSSTDAGDNWSPRTDIAATIPAINLKGIAYAPVIGTTGAGTFVAVGSSGTVLTSTDGGTSWTMPASPFATTTTINAVTYGRQFIAVAEDGSIFTSIDGLIWTATSTPPANSSPAYAITHGPYDYTAVGSNGLNMHAM